MKAPRLFHALALVLFTLSAFGQSPPEVRVYKTYEDFTEDRGEDYDSFKHCNHGMGSVTMVFLRDGEKKKVACKDIWGFRYKDALFRVEKTYSQPARLLVEGALCFYGNGWAHLTMLKDGVSEASYPVGAESYLSSGVRAPLIPGGPGGPAFVEEAARKLGTKYRPFFACVGKDGSNEKFFQCLKEFNESAALKNRLEKE